MKTEKEIKTSHKQAHDTLSEQFYKYGLWTQEEFNQLHNENWEHMEAELLSEGYRPVPVPPRDLAAEVDTLKTKVDQLEKK